MDQEKEAEKAKDILDELVSRITELEEEVSELQKEKEQLEEENEELKDKVSYLEGEAETEDRDSARPKVNNNYKIH